MAVHKKKMAYLKKLKREGRRGDEDLSARRCMDGRQGLSPSRVADEQAGAGAMCRRLPFSDSHHEPARCAASPHGGISRQPRPILLLGDTALRPTGQTVDLVEPDLVRGGGGLSLDDQRRLEIVQGAHRLRRRQR